jgi:cell division inhibitor SepF
MSALRKAGVWLGLVEEDDERRDDGVFDDEFNEDDDEFAPTARPRSLTRPAPRVTDRDRDRRDRELDRDRDPRSADREQRIADQRAAERGTRTDPDRSLRMSEADERAAERAAERDARMAESRATEGNRSERASVRQLARPSSTSGSAQGSSVSYPTHDNLALAPQVQLRERAVVNDEKSRRYQITTLHPTTYNEARAIGEHFRDGYPVIMNLTEMDEADAKRLVDFAAGLAFGVRGSMERVTNRVFLLSPPNIQVSAEDKARIAEGGFFDQA